MIKTIGINRRIKTSSFISKGIIATKPGYLDITSVTVTPPGLNSILNTQTWK